MNGRVCLSWRSSLRVSLLVSASVLACTASVAQSLDVSAKPVSVQGFLERLATFAQLRSARQQTRAFEEVGRSEPRPATQMAELKMTARDNAQADAQIQAAQGATPPPSSLVSILSFSPPNTFDEGSCGGVRFGNGGLAANANFLLEAGTSCVKILNPATGAVLSGPTSLSKFFGSSASTSNVRALYDPVNGRFLLSAEDYSSNRLWLGASQTSDPTQNWILYSFPMSGTCTNGAGDNPKLGQTYAEAGDLEGAIYLSWDIYCPSSGLSNFVGALSKTAVYSGTPVSTIEGFQGLNVNGTVVDGIQPVNVMNPGDRPRGEFLVNSYNLHFGGGSCVNGCNGIVVWDFFNGVPGNNGSQSLTAVVVPTANTYYLPTNAPQPGCAANSCGPSTGEPVMGGEINYSAGSVFGALNDGMGVLIVELEPEVDDAGAITGALMRNEICFACGGFSNGGQAYDGAIQPDSERNWVMVYNYSAPGTAGCTPDVSACVYPSLAFVTRRVTQAQNTVDNGGGIVALGQGYYSQVNPAGVNRWADYSAVGANYVLSNAFWFDGEYSESRGSWGTVVGQTGYTSSTQP